MTDELTPLAGLAERIAADAIKRIDGVTKDCDEQQIALAASTHLEPIGEVLRECRRIIKNQIRWVRGATYDIGICESQVLEQDSNKLIVKLDALLETKGGE